VNKILEEHSSGKEQSEETGTFALHYTPSNVDEKPITIPLSTSNTLHHNRSNHSIQNGGQQDMNPNNIIFSF